MPTDMFNKHRILISSWETFLSRRRKCTTHACFIQLRV